MNDLSSRGPIGQKSTPLVSSAIRASARGECCTLRLWGCNHDPETTVYAHLRFFSWGGLGAKPHDLLGVYACSECHRALDEGDAWGFDDLLRAHGETIVRMYEMGLIKVQK